jgi:predicted MFS family arabinose efflux permease
LSAAQFAVSLESILSPLLAAVILSFVTFHVLFVGTAIGFVGSTALVVGAAVPPASPSGRERFVERLGAGVRTFAATPRLRAVLAFDMVVAASGAVTVVSTVNVVHDLFGGTDGDVALLLAVAGCGTATAAVVTPALLRRFRERAVLLAGTAVLVVAMAGAVVLATAPTRFAAVVVWLLIGTGGGLVMVPIGRVVRRSSAAEDRPAVFAAQFSLSHLCWLVAYPVAGWGGTLAGFTTAWAVLGALVAVSGALAAVLWPPGLRDIVRHSHDDGVDSAHVAEAEWDGTTWVHTHHLVIDANHTRWPAAGR